MFQVFCTEELSTEHPPDPLHTTDTKLHHIILHRLIN
jgi:hypothetical protein